MRTVDFETIMVQGLQSCGLDRYSINDQTYGQMRDFANNRIRFAWEYDAWPDLIRSVRFPVTNNGSIHYIVIPNDGIVTNTEGTFKVDVGTVMQVTVEDPRTTGKVKEIGFSLDEQDLVLSNFVTSSQRRIIVNTSDPITELFVTFRINCPELIGEIWKPGITYNVGEIAYYAYNTISDYFAPVRGTTNAGKKGNFWKCLVQTSEAPNVSGASLPVVGDKWEKVKIPQFLGQYIIKGIHSDWLKSEQQIEAGFALDKDALALLDFEIHKIIVQQGQTPRIKFNQIY
jgi:hypothetical protein